VVGEQVTQTAAPRPARFRPANPLRASDWLVRALDPMIGRALIARYHYAGGTSNTATACHGLVHRETQAVKSVAWWIPPTRTAAAACWEDPEAVLSLSRLVILPDVPTNAASFLLMRSARTLNARWRCLVTWADSERGHDGGIYRAAGWEYLGLSTPTDVWVDADGRRVARKAGPTTRTRDEMRGLGHVFLGYFAKHRFRLVRRRFPAVPQLSLFDEVSA
jgi:hypothetical protein